MTRLARRRGMALVLVLGLLAITLAASYALLRTQSYDRKIMENHGRRGDARANAQIGAATALRRMYDGTWGGADSTFTVNIDSSNSFTVSYATGDATLAPAGAEGWKIPYRETITIVGKSCDPLDAVSESTHQIQVVTEFVRRKLNTNQVAATNLESYTLYHSGTGTCHISYPFRVNGNVFIQGLISTNDNYPSPKESAAYDKYFKDLEKLARLESIDQLPFSGTIYTPNSVQGPTGDCKKTLDVRLKISVSNVAVDNTPAVPNVTSVSNYRLYPGGKSYSAAALPTTFQLSLLLDGPEVITSGTYSPDPLTNPLGLRTLNSKSASVRNNTTINGSVENFGSSVASNLYVAGDTITINPIDLPSITGDATTYQLAAFRAAGSIFITNAGATRRMNGLYVANGQFTVPDGSAAARVNFQGTAAAATVKIGGRSLWDRGDTYWADALAAFNAVRTTPKYFPQWMANNRSADSFFLEQRLLFDPLPVGIKYHVPDWSQPVYVAHDSDGGLIWDIVRWTESQ